MEPKKRLIKIMGFSKRNHFKHSRQPAKGCRVVGITGTGRGTGVTHLSVLAANYMASALQRRTAVIEWNDHGAWKTMKDICQAGSVKQADSADYRYKIFGVTYYMQGAPRVLASCLDGTYDEVIIDFGELRPSIRAEWLRCEVKIVMAALSEWKLEAFLELLSEEEGRRAGWIYTAAFGSEDTRKQIERQFGISLVRVPLSVDAFSVDYKTMQWFERIL